MEEPCVYQLDRNVVIEIENFHAGKPATRVDEIREIDLAHNVVSPLLSILEGHTQHRRDTNSFASALDRESATVDRFFQQARTDSLELGRTVLLAEHFIAEVRSTQDADLAFLRDIQRTFAFQEPASQARAAYAKARELIRAHSRPVTDKLAFACIACALGSLDARGILKPSPSPQDAGAFNALADFEKLSMLNYMRSLAVRMGVTSNIELFSFDAALVAYSKVVRPESAQVTLDGSDEVVRYVIAIDPFLDALPHLRDKSRLCREIKADLENAGGA